MSEIKLLLRSINVRYMIIFIIMEVVIIALLFQLREHNRATYLTNRALNLEIAATSVVNKFEAVAHTLFHEIIDKPEIHRLQAAAVLATPAERQKIHDRLYAQFGNSYLRLQQESPLQIQFILPDGTSLLRMHEPEHWGDRLYAHRKIIHQSFLEQRELSGYESGRYAVGAYRFLFPLKSGGAILGTVELSLFADTLVKELDKLNKNNLWFMLVRRDTALSGLLDTRQKDAFNTPSRINPEFFEIWPGMKAPPANPLLNQLTAYRDVSKLKMLTSSGKLFSKGIGPVDGIPAAVAFIPIQNVDGKHEAYLVGLGSAPLLEQYDRNILVMLSLSTVLLLAITLLARRQAMNRRKLTEERETLKAITNAMGEGLLVQDPAGRLLYLNPKAEELLGYSAEELKSGGVHALIHRHGEDEQGRCPILHTTSLGTSYHSNGEEFATAHGELLPVELVATPLLRNSVNIGSVSVFKDIREQKAFQSHIARLNNLYAALSKTNHAIVHIKRVEELFAEICRIAVELAGFKAAFVGSLSADGTKLLPVAAAGEGVRNLDEAITILHSENKGCQLAHTLPERVSHICRHRCVMSGMVERSGVCLGDKSTYIGVYPLSCDGRVTAALVFYSDEPDSFDDLQTALLEEMAEDVSFAIDMIHRAEMHQQAQDELQRISNYDALTGLPNRALFFDRLEQGIATSAGRRTPIAILLVGLDRFKGINNSFGHSYGDLVLRDVARRLQEAIPQNATLARPGGDEFLIMAPDVSMAGSAHLAGQLLTAISGQPVQIGMQALTISAHVGISIWPDDAEQSADLIKNAYSALNRAKHGDEGSYQFFTDDMTASSIERLTLENELRKALRDEQFILYYQAKVHASTGRPAGCEALVRWRHPGRGVVAPVEFIPLMEEIGLIGHLGDWVLREACRQAVLWNKSGCGDLNMAVNLSPLQLKRPNLVGEVRDILGDTGLPPRLLELEITESTAMNDVEQTITVIDGLKSLGVRIAIDDFGTGYSSLSHLKRLSVDTLKIDRSFVMDLPDDKDDRAITEVILALAAGLGMEVVAEGVETAEQAEFLRLRHCHYLQGYYYSKPLPPDSFAAFIRSSSQAG